MQRDGARAAIAASFQKHNSGDREALAELVPVVGEELRRIARASGAGTPLTNSLSSLYLRLANETVVPIQDHATFLAVCATAVRHAIVEHMGEDGAPERLSGTDFIRQLDAALRAVGGVSARLTRIVECRYFAGLTEEETARALEVDLPTIKREWTRARAWTLRELTVLESGENAATIPNAAWVDAVFDDALALPPGKLEPFLDRCAAAPGELRARVEELLRFSSATTPRLEPGDLSPDFVWSVLQADPTEVSPPEHPEGRLALSAHDVPAAPSQGWRIVGELRHGRPGGLYLAERPDRPSWPTGALRFVPGATHADLDAFRRRLDWRVLSSLDHGAIARFIDVGAADDGRLFIVSELVEGRPIDGYCDEEHLTVAERLELFLKVCHAVQYAHRKLAVHGAIEPSNVLVTADGEVKLLDLGLVRLLADDAVGSPEFASPEQLRGEPLAVASDVYQLGLLLYRLLTGESAQVVEAATPQAIEETVSDKVLLPPSQRVLTADPRVALLRRTRRHALAKALRGDLDAIVMYALRRDPDRRYPSVSLLRSDIQRYAKRQPVWAQGEGLAYRFRMFAARRRVPLAAAIVLVTIGAATLPGRVFERPGASSTTVEAAEVEQLIREIHAPTSARSGAELPNPLHVEQAARMARRELASDPERQSRLFTEIGLAYASLGYYERSLSILEEGLTLRRTNAGDDSLAVAETLEARGKSRHQLARYDEAEADLRSVIAIRQVRLGGMHPDTISATIALGDLLHARGRLLDSEQVLRGAVEALRPGIVKVAAGAPANELLARALGRLANVTRDRGAIGEASALYREVIALLEGEPGAEPRIAATRVDLSATLLARAELDRAEAQLAEALPALRRAHPDDHPLVGVALREYGLLRLEQRRLDEAGEFLADALRIQEAWLGRTHPLVPRTRGALAELERRRGRASEAVELATAALKDFERLGMPDHPWTVEIRATLADALIAIGRAEEALRVLGPALTSAPRMFVSYDARLARLQDALVRASRGQTDALPGGRGPTGPAP